MAICCAAADPASTAASPIAHSPRASSLVMAISSRREVDHGEPPDLGTAARRLDVIEVDAGRDELVIPIAEVPGGLAAAGRIAEGNHRHQHPAHGVDPDNALRR